MVKRVKTLIANSDARLIEDAFGLAALIVILFGALHIPSVI